MPGKLKTYSTRRSSCEIQKIQPDDLDGRRHCVWHGVDHDDAPSRYAFERRHLGVVGLESLNHRRSHHPEDVGDDDDYEGRHGQDKELWLRPGIHTRRKTETAGRM